MQRLEEDGKPKFAVLPWGEYQALLALAGSSEDEQDIVDSRKSLKTSERTPQEVVRALVNGNPVKVWREHRKHTQYELAEMVGISPAYLSKIESGKQDGSVKVQKKIALALDIDLDDINS